jgi:hypothetical protein
MESKGSFQYCKKIVKILGERARRLVAEVEGENEGDEGVEGGKASGILKILEKVVI